jgi:DNA-binding response OmpR family regulator
LAEGKILVVEDEPAVGRALARSLEREGYTVDLARTHADSLAFMGSYDVGVFDIELPDSDGVELAKRLVTRHVVKDIVFFSGLADGKSEARARAYGAYVHKSEGIQRLFTVISGLLRPS